MSRPVESLASGTLQEILKNTPGIIAEEGAGVEAELARYLPHLARMSAQLKQTSEQIESSVAGVCNNFQGISERAGVTVARTTKLTAQVSDLIANLWGLAGSTLGDLQRMNEQGHKQAEECRLEVEESLRDLQAAHGEMKEMLTGMTEDGASLESDIGAAVRGLQFQDRTSQRIGHVVADLDMLHARLESRFGTVSVRESATDEGFSAYTMREEREVAGLAVTESAEGEVELF